MHKTLLLRLDFPPRRIKKSQFLIIYASLHFTNNHFRPSLPSRPLLVKKKMRLSSVHVKSTSKILKADALKFSPCIGLLTSSTPNLIANLRSVRLDLPAPELARELFHQRTSSYDENLSTLSRRYGPVAITKSRSRASYWLTSEIMGTMVGLAKSSADGKVFLKILCYDIIKIPDNTFQSTFSGRVPSRTARSTRRSISMELRQIM